MFPWGRFSDKQTLSLMGPHKRLNIWWGSVRSGKTITSLAAWVNYVKVAPPGNLAMFGKTGRTLKENILLPLLDMVGDANFSFNIYKGEGYLLGRKVIIIGVNDIKAEGKIRGVTLAGAYCDELTLYPEDFFVQLLARLSVKGAKLFATTNPDSPYHWLKTGYIDRADELSMNCYQFTLDDNPNLDPEYIAAIKQEYTGLWFKRYILGLWCMAEGAVYDLDPDVYLVDKLPAIQRYWVAIDYGITDPIVMLLMGLGYRDMGPNIMPLPTLYVIKEFRYDAVAKRQPRADDSRLGKMYLEFVTGFNIDSTFIDPSAASFIVHLFDNLRRKEVMGAWNEVLDGIRFTHLLLSTGRLKLYKPGLQGLAEELTAYAWDEKAALRGDTKPAHEASHGPDALRYGVAGTRKVWHNWYKTAIIRDIQSKLPTDK